MLAAYKLGGEDPAKACAAAESQPLSESATAYALRAQQYYLDWLKELQTDLESTGSKLTARPGTSEVPAVVPQQFVDEESRVRYIVGLGRLAPNNRDKLAHLLLRTCSEHKIDPLLAAALIRVRSDFRWFQRHGDPPQLGLWSLTTADAEVMARACKVPWTGRQTLLSPASALRLGLSYLALLQKRFSSDERKTLTAFLAGPAQGLRFEPRADAKLQAVVEGVLALRDEWREKLTLRRN